MSGNRPVRAVLFDYGHTLVDFTVPEDALFAVYGDIRPRLQLEAEREVPDADHLVELVARRVTRSVEQSYERDRLVELDILALFEASLTDLGFHFQAETVRWVAETEHRALTRHLIFPPESSQVLSAITDMGLKIGIVSNAHLLPEMMREDWDKLGIGRFVRGSAISSELGLRKPHPDLFMRVLGALEVDARDAVFVGDRVYDDIGGAKALGMRAILTRQFPQEPVNEGDAVPDLIVNRLSEIIPYVKASE